MTGPGAGLGGCHRIAPMPPRRSHTSHERIMPNRRTMNVIALAGVMLLLGLGAGRTEDYPSRPVRLIITTPAGSLVDVLEHVPPRLNQGDSRGAKDGRVYRH